MFDSYDKRMAFALETAGKARVDGVVLQSIKNCDCYGVDNVMLEKDLEARGLPVLVLEREYNPMADTGRIKTRVQAFLERIGSRR
jgi:benzoyl-CoA reductase/2-hydroxyglutaryl-CoA dehydratase subunit BcrC/BadD/HgdB